MEQYGRRNNIEIIGIPECVENEKLEETVVEVLNKIDLNVSNNDIEACHRLGKQKNKPRKTIIRFVNGKFAKKAILNRKGLKHADTSSLGLDSHKVFINENLTRANSKIAFHSRSLKRNSLIDECYTKDGVVHIVCPDLQMGKLLRYSILILSWIYSRTLILVKMEELKTTTIPFSQAIKLRNCVILVIFTIYFAFIFSWNGVF